MKNKLRALIFGIGIFLCTAAISADHYAEVISINTSQSVFDSSLLIYATIKSSDKDCEHYVNWWEAVSEDGQLLYRRILRHPHSNEQPFNRGGSTDTIKKETIFYVRAHIHPYGYSNKGMKGSVKSGFKPVIIPEGFAAALASSTDIPGPCHSNKN
ncbi:MAG: hypothetical protein GQ475_00445 [Methylococcaceae bacterium]|nr:hypothetical protein [Methylococcaceae bacterium]